LETQYKLNNEESSIRLKKSDQNYKNLIENLKNQTKHTRIQIETNKNQYECELRNITDRQLKEMYDITQDRKSTMTDLESKYNEIKQIYENQLKKLAQNQEENHDLRLRQKNEIVDYQSQLKQCEDELEELKHRHFVTTQDHLSNLLLEKSQLKEAFEGAIKKLKNAHDQDVIELKDQIA